MTAPQNNITERVNRCTNNIIDCKEITADGMAVIIEAYRKDLQNLLLTEKIIDNVMIRSTQTYFSEIGSNLDNKISSNRIIIAAIEKLSIVFRKTIKTHNSNLINTNQEVIQKEIESPETIEQLKESTTIIQKNKRGRKKKSNRESEGKTQVINSIEKKPSIIFPESYITKNIFGSNTKPIKKEQKKSYTESLFDIKMRALSPSQSAKSRQNSSIRIDNPITPLNLTKEEIKQIQTIFNSEQLKEIKIRSIIGKLDEIRTIQKNYETVITNYSEIISILIKQNQTKLTATQIEYIEKSKNILNEISNKFKNSKNSPHLFKAIEQKNNSSEKISTVSEYIKLLVQFS